MFFSPRRTRRFAIAIAVALVFSLPLALLTDSPEGALHRGDFPAFYAAGVIAQRGDVELLYQSDMQRAVENEFFPELRGEYLAFAYPPYVAILLSPLAHLNPQTAKLLLIGGMFLALLGALVLGDRLVPRVGSWQSLVFHLSFLPLLSGLAAGQNTAVSMFLAAAFLLSFSRRRDILAGVALGLWFFKPHFALIPLLLCVAVRRWKVIAGALPLIALFYLIAARELGLRWPLGWIRNIRLFAGEDAGANGFQMISLPGTAAALHMPTSVGVGLAAVVLAMALWRVVQSPEQGMKIFPLVAILVSPHTLYYEAALAILSVLAFTRFDSDREVTFLAVLWVLAGFLTVTRSYYPAQPLVLLLVTAFAVIWMRSADSRQFSV